MSTTTSNLGLIKPERSDNYSVDVMGNNMDIIDAKVGGFDSRIAALEDFLKVTNFYIEEDSEGDYFALEPINCSIGTSTWGKTFSVTIPAIKTLYNYYYDKGYREELFNMFYQYNVLGDETFLTNYPESAKIKFNVSVKSNSSSWVATLTIKDASDNVLYSTPSANSYTGTGTIDVPLSVSTALTVSVSTPNSGSVTATLTPVKYGIRYEKVPLA